MFLPTGLQSPGVGFSNLGLAKVRWPACLRAPSVGVYQGIEQVNLPDGLQDPSSLFNLSVEQVDMPAGQRFYLSVEEVYLPAGSRSLGLSLPNLNLEQMYVPRLPEGSCRLPRASTKLTPDCNSRTLAHLKIYALSTFLAQSPMTRGCSEATWRRLQP